VRDRPGFILAYGIFIGLLAGGALWLLSQPKRGAPVQLRPPSEPVPIQVHVSGEVNQPGVVELPSGSRVFEAIEAAGGVSSAADPDSLNLAAVLVDGQRIFVPAKREPGDESAGADAPAAAIVFPIDLNAADQPTLESLPGIGPEKAKAIIAFRTANGPFRALEDLDAVDGIGPAIISDIEELVVINP
jgi:competence protein ComEA